MSDDCALQFIKPMLGDIVGTVTKQDFVGVAEPGQAIATAQKDFANPRFTTFEPYILIEKQRCTSFGCSVAPWISFV